MKKISFAITFGFLMLICCSCTENARTRKFGGTSVVDLDPGQKLIEVTWKDNDLWYLTEPMESKYEAKTKVFQEISQFGIMEGKIIFHESR